MCDVNLDDACSVWAETNVKRARKAHGCDCCGGSIRPGDSYKRIGMVFDGTASTERECRLCGVMMAMFKAMHRQWMSPSGMRELLHECIADEQTYDEDNDKYVPAGPGRWWAAALAEMNTRRAGRAA